MEIRYESPMVEFIEVEVEKGFATSPPIENPIHPGNDQKW